MNNFSYSLKFGPFEVISLYLKMEHREYPFPFDFGNSSFTHLYKCFLIKDVVI